MASSTNSKLVVRCFSVSADGYGAGPDQSIDNPLGVGGPGLHEWILPTQTFQNGPTVLPTIYGPAFFNSDLGLFKNFQIKESMKLQFRIQANNFLNHPLWSMSQGSAMNLSFSQDASGKITQNNTQFGTAQYKTGQRIVQLAVKFYF